MFSVPPHILILSGVNPTYCQKTACQELERRYSDIMNTVRYVLQPLRNLFDRLKAVTMPEMKSALGTGVDQTVFRKLAPLSYRTSYSHRGAFYTLESIPRFDEHGLWICRGACFSRQRTLLATARSLVREAPAGYFAYELEARLHVSVKDALRQLVNERRLERQLLGPLYSYTAPDRVRRQEQWAARQAQRQARDPEQEQLRAAIALFYSLLDEQQQRLYAGLESIKLGRGGDTLLADFLGVDPHKVARGRQQLVDRDVATGRVRKPGGGRKATEKKRPQ